MKSSNLMASVTRKLLFIILGVILILALAYYLWETNKFSFVRNKLNTTVIEKTDSLYTIKYDSLYFDEISGQAYLRNIRITPDTNRVKNLPPEKRPYLLLDISIKSIAINGVKTDKALQSNELIGDSIIIDQPKILVYFIKPVKKETKIDAEAKNTYEQILGNLKLIKVGEVIIKDARINAIHFENRFRQFDVNNINIRLHDVLVDSAHSEDTSRILFCKDAAFKVDEFTSYNRNRPELTVKDVSFVSLQKRITFSKLLLNRFDKNTGKSILLVDAENMLISGINNHNIIKQKDFLIDTILCRYIKFYKPPALAVNPTRAVKVQPDETDTSGFRNAYSLNLGIILLPDIDIIETTVPAVNNNFKLGKFAVKIRGVKANAISDMEVRPIDHTKEVDIKCSNFSYNSDDKLYQLAVQNLNFNSLRKQISAGSFKFTPLAGEEVFAKNAGKQKDRYDITLNGISLNNIDLDQFLNKKIFANSVTINSGRIKIYRDISRPLDGVNKVGNYPHQQLMKSEMPIDIKRFVLNNLYLEYKEKNALTNRTGTIPFERTKLSIDNLTNVPASIKNNSSMTANLQTNVLGTLPVNIIFKFFLTATDGKFSVNGNLGSTNITSLNVLTKPMASLQIDSGFIENAKFNFTGNDDVTNGEFEMRYKDLKVALMKKNEDNSLKKRGLFSFLANTLIKNENPHDGKLRIFDVQYDRDPQKSFFNLVWKTIFTGIQGTIGMPVPKMK